MANEQSDVVKDLKIQAINNPGDPEKEYVLLRVINDCNLEGYILFDNTYTDVHNLSNKERHFYAFKSLDVKKGQMIALYTKNGKYNLTPEVFDNNLTYFCHNIFWGLGTHIWNTDGDTVHVVYVCQKASKTYIPRVKKSL